MPKQKQNRTYAKRLTKKRMQIRIDITILTAFMIGAAAIGIASNLPYAAAEAQNSINVGPNQNQAASAAPAPEISVIDVKSGTIREATAYNSVEWQTDATPCIAADGSDVCKRYQAGECIVAANFVPLGSKLYVDHFGLCTVADRMAKKHPNRIDIFMDKDIDRAVKFGKQNLLVKIIEK